MTSYQRRCDDHVATTLIRSHFDVCVPAGLESLWRFDHEIFSMVILSNLLIQEGQLSVSSKRMGTILVN